MSYLYKDDAASHKGPAIPSPYEDDDALPEEPPSSFTRLNDDEFKKIISFVTKIQRALLPVADADSRVVSTPSSSNAADVANKTDEITTSNSNTADIANKTDEIITSNSNTADVATKTDEITTSNSNTASVATKTVEITTSNPNAADVALAYSGSNDDKRPIEMLVTDVEYIKKNIDGLKSSVNRNRADVLLHYLMEAAEEKRRKVEDFTQVNVNLKKLLQIVAKLKLWVPPKRDGDLGGPASAAKKEESPFISSKEKENAATEIVKELVGLRCRQWGLDGLLDSYGQLTDTVKNCLLCFSVFKCDVDKDRKTGVLIQRSLLIKKRILIHWWVAEGLIDLYQNVETPNPDPIPNPQPDPSQVSQSQESNSKKTIEEIGEEILKILVKKGFIEPVIKKAQESGSFQMHPFVHSFVTALAKRAGFFDFSDMDGQLTPSFRLSRRACLVKSKDKLSSCQQWATYTDDRNRLKKFGEVQTLFNVNESIIDIKPEWFSKMKNLYVLHLGGWRSDPVEHIEVEDQKFLEDLKIMKQLRLFSLQGLSTIMKLTDSVCALTNLIILDLKECHNLEELPSEIGSLKNLTHLDITNCHLLTKLPIGISLLPKLEVLKGFVIYDQASDQQVGKTRGWWRKTKGCLVHDVFRCKNKEVCTLKDLLKLKNLRKLSLVVNIDEFPSKEEVQVFREMRALYKLKISWERSFKEIGGDNKASKEPSKKRGGDHNTASEEPSKKSGGDHNTASEEPSKKSGGDHNTAPEEPSNECSGDNIASEESSKKSGWCFPCIGPAAVTENVSTRGLEAQNEAKEVCCCNPQSKDVKKPNELLDQIQKLELWCFPHKKPPEWLQPSQLKNLNKLYIKGGELEELPGDIKENKWVSVETLRLKYLPELDILWPELKDTFPNMKYLEKYQCKKLRFFPCDQEGVWKSWEERLRERTIPPTAETDWRARCEQETP